METEEQKIRISTTHSAVENCTTVRASITYSFELEVIDEIYNDPSSKELFDEEVKNKLKVFVRREAIKL